VIFDIGFHKSVQFFVACSHLCSGPLFFLLFGSGRRTDTRERAAKAGVQLKAIQADLENYQLPAAEFDVVLCFHYLQRSLFAPTVAALKPGGALVVQTYTMEQLQFPRGPRRREHLLEPNELFRAFRRLRVAYYREVTRDERAIASLLAYKL